jgi:hypothetical protein
MLQGFAFTTGDLGTYLAFTLHHHDPAHFKNDLLIGTLSSHPVLIWNGFAFFLRWAGLETLVRIAFVLQTLLITAGALLFFRSFFGQGRRWMFFVMVLVVPVTSGGLGVYGLNPYGYFHAGAVAFGLTLFAAVLIDGRRWIWAGALCGAIFLIHPITAVYGFGFFGVTALFDLFKKRNIPGIIAGSALLVIASLPSLLPELRSLLSAAPGSVDTQLWFQLAENRMGNGYFISRWVPDRFIQTGACFAAILFLFRKHPAFKRTLPIVITVAIGLLAAALGDLFNIRFFLRLQPARWSYFIFFLTAAFAANAVASAALLNEGKKARIVWTVAAIVCLLLIGKTVLSGQPHWAKQVLVSLIIVAAIGCVLAVFYRIRPAFFMTAVAAIILINTVSRAESRFVWSRAAERKDPWVDAAVWCGKNIPPNETIMIPIYRQDFRPHALRSVFVTWKDGAPHLFCDATLPEWWRRMQLFGVSLPYNRSDLPRYYHAGAFSAARAENLRYVVFEKRFARWSGQLIYENKDFGVIDLRGWGGSLAQISTTTFPSH